ncbi:hypothetical protein QB794_004611 [Salmonella enterica]|nr:hypothetical protein [Salmonella enterica]EKS4863988.1 hypothetical protein [Salmonella enterica]EKS4882801.1 hypothetical protein [Salmonella enterica]EKS4887409.1 hypothetical protein [Salmonella enterica]EKS5974950.1 hypothetical protein [Salmonella enterica]
MKEIYFIHQDKNAFERQSDGVEFCVIPEFYNGKVYFYCEEYSVFWSDINDAGDLDKCCDFSVKNKIRPATLNEISNCALISYIDAIKEYDIENGKLIKLTYIHLK